MILDFKTERATRFEADLCIVGAGLAGISLALQFEADGWRVLLLESGGPEPDPATQDLYHGETDMLPHHGVHDGRARTYGGTTTLWGGQALPLFPIDFQSRTWVPHSGWPLFESELMPLYAQAATLLQTSGGSYDASSGAALGIQVPAFDPNKLDLAFSQWSPQPNFVFAYHHRLRRADAVQVLMHANVVSIVQASAHGPVRFVRIKTLEGKLGEVHARHFVLCTGGIETARLLLASDELKPEGVGNASGAVGRFFQDHIAVKCGAILPSDRRAFQDVFDQAYRGRVKYLPKLVYPAIAQRNDYTLNAIGNVVFVTPDDAPVMQAKRFYAALRRRQRPAQIHSVVPALLRGSGELARLLYRYRVEHRSYSPAAGEIYLEAHLEQEPDPESRVTLTDVRDALGMRRTQLSWQVARSSWTTACQFAQNVASEFERLRLGRIDLCIQPDAATLPWQLQAADLNHHMGTTRMSLTPSDGVVNPHCGVHEVENLHIASSSVFPTSGSSNPSLTILALTLRLADRLKTLL